MTYLDKDQVLAALTTELDSRILSCRRQYCSRNKMCVRHEGFSDAVQLLAALPAIPLDAGIERLKYLAAHSVDPGEVAKLRDRANEIAVEYGHVGDHDLGVQLDEVVAMADALLEVSSALPVLETPPPRDFHNLRVSVENDYITAKFTCTAPEGAQCRLICTDSDCEYWTFDGTHPLIDGGRCGAKEWFEAVDWLEVHESTGHESLLYDGPVNAFWDGEEFQWQIDGAPVEPAPLYDVLQKEFEDAWVEINRLGNTPQAQWWRGYAAGIDKAQQIGAPVPAPRLEWKGYEAKGGGTTVVTEGFEIQDDQDRGGWTLYVDKVHLKTLDAAYALAENIEVLLSPPVGPQE